MKTTQVSARWTGENLDYIGIDAKGNEILMGKQHIAPSQMLLLGLAGCMGMDILSILEKKRQDVTHIDIQLTAQQPDEYPKPFQQIDIAFTVKGNNVDPKAVARAIQLSEEKYCVVGQTLQNSPELNTTFTVEA